jgi:hypothetical protein
MFPFFSKKTSDAGVWEPSAGICTVCNAAFSFLFRQHHCRACGRVVCDVCSKARRRLKSSRTGRLKRVCISCVTLGVTVDGEDGEEGGGGGGGDGVGKKAAEPPHIIDLAAGTGRLTALDQARDGELPVTAAAAIECVRDKRGLYNWALFETTPEPPLLLVNAGTLSIAECRRYLLPDKTYCGLLRCAFGQGRERRVKIVFLTFTGATASVVARARANNAKAFMKSALGVSSLDIQATNPLELDPESIVDKLKKIAGTGVVGVEEAGGSGAGASPGGENINVRSQAPKAGPPRFVRSHARNTPATPSPRRCSLI